MQKRYVAYYDASLVDDEKALDVELATCYKDGLMSKEDKAKLDSISAEDTNEPVIESLEASKVVQDETHRFVTDEQIAAWDSVPTKEDLELGNVTNDAQVKRTEMGVAGGVATLDDAGLIPTAQLPGFVDDVVEAATMNDFPTEGESGKLYVDTTENKTYRWTGTQYTEIPTGGIALGETSATAYAGDKGKAVTDAVNGIIDGTTVVPKATDAGTVNGFTVDTNVPATAKFTDTVFEHPETHPATMIVEDETHKFATEAQLVKVDAIPEDAKFTDTVYTHPETHPATMIVEDETHKFATEAQLVKVDAIPEDAKFTDTVYTHPETHPATMIVEDETHKFATEAQLVKVDAIPEDAKFTDTVYTHPETHPATMIVEDETHKFVTDEQVAYWDAKADVVKYGPFYDEANNCFYACGVPIIVDAIADGKLLVKWVDKGEKSMEIKEGGKIFGGGLGKDMPVHYTSTCVTFNSGKVTSIYGGNDLVGNVGTATVIINGGTITSGVIVGGRGAVGDSNLTGYGELIVNDVDDTLTIYGGPQGLAVVGSTKVTVNNGNIDWLTAGGSNGHTGVANITVNGGNVQVLQGCNRGTMGNIKMTINGGTIEKVYAGGETEDTSVTATYVKAEVFVNGGTIGRITAGTNGGVEDATKVSGNYVEGVITDEAATAMNLVKAPVTFTDVVFEGGNLVFKNGDVVVKTVTIA